MELQKSTGFLCYVISYTYRTRHFCSLVVSLYIVFCDWLDIYCYVICLLFTEGGCSAKSCLSYYFVDFFSDFFGGN
jgi:hypothetical protein